jgi:hypothetical protein
MVAPLLWAVFAVLLGADGDVLHVEAKTAWGIAELNEQLFVTDCAAASLLGLHTDGSVISSMRTGESEKASRPRGLCVVGELLAYVDELTRRIIYVDATSMTARGQIPAPGPRPMGLAFDGAALWCADHKEGRLYRLDARTGRVMGYLPAPGHAPHALDWSEGKLWVQDALDHCAYRVDPATGAVEASVALPGKLPRGILVRPGALLVVMAGKNDVVEAAYREDDGCTVSLPIEAHVRLECEVKPRGKGGAPGGARCVVAIPPESPRQQIENLKFFPEGHKTIEDAHGQQYAEWEVPALEEGGQVVVGWEADVQVWAMRFGFVPRGRDVPAPIDAAYLASSHYITTGAPEIQELTAGLKALHPIPGLLALRDRILERMSYKLEGGWDPADKVLARGTGSCSEYTFVLVSAGRSMGLPMRFAGGAVLQGPKDARKPQLERIDTVAHRWAEAFVEGAGWLPVDANRDDRKSPPFSRANFLALPNRTLVCSRTPLCENATMGTRYRAQLLRPRGSNHWHYGIKAIWTLKDIRPWTP